VTGSSLAVPFAVGVEILSLARRANQILIR
jgi:hypothetical protein